MAHREKIISLDQIDVDQHGLHRTSLNPTKQLVTKYISKKLRPDADLSHVPFHGLLVYNIYFNRH